MIGVAYISKDRPVHLQKSLESMLSQTVLPNEVVIVDCSDDKDSIISVINDAQKNSPVKIQYEWRHKTDLSRSQGRSLGRQFIKSPFMVSTEADIMYDHELIEECLSVLKDEKIYLHVRACRLGPDGERGPIRLRGTGFFQCYRVKDFDDIGGYNPFLSGWGSEDTDFTDRMIKHGCKEIQLRSVVYHMWHESATDRANNKANVSIIQSSYWDGNRWKKK